MTDLFDSTPTFSGATECLGQTFPNEQARREHFTKLLAEKLKDPAFRKIEGFPLGTDEAILAMSDPPYYTACPNPFLEEFVLQYGKPYDPSVTYSREPQTIDVSVGKTDPLYKAHSYHTKVPHLAIVHYTEPGDVVLDGFAGSGMTGVAAQWCGSAPAAYRHGLESEWKKQGKAAPKWGSRRVILNDLSPAATFIGANYNLPFDVDAFAEAGRQLLDDVERDIGWMYETIHTDGKTKGRIEYTIWSEVFACPDCAGEVNFLDEALDKESKRVRDVFPCPHCDATLTKKKLDRLYLLILDAATGETISTPKRVPTLIAYRIGKAKYEKKPDAADLALLVKIETIPLPCEVPTVAFPYADMWEAPRMRDKGISHTHHLFLSRAVQAMGALWAKAQAQPDARMRAFLTFMVEQAIAGLSVLNRYGPTHFSQVNRMLAGVYYVASQHAECSPWYILDGKLDRLTKAFRLFKTSSITAVTTGTAARLPLPSDSVDYKYFNINICKKIDLLFFLK